MGKKKTRHINAILYQRAYKRVYKFNLIAHRIAAALRHANPQNTRTTSTARRLRDCLGLHLTKDSLWWGVGCHDLHESNAPRDSIHDATGETNDPLGGKLNSHSDRAGRGRDGHGRIVLFCGHVDCGCSKAHLAIPNETHTTHAGSHAFFYHRDSMEAGHFAPDAGVGARKALCNRRSLGEETYIEVKQNEQDISIFYEQKQSQKIEPQS